MSEHTAQDWLGPGAGGASTDFVPLYYVEYKSGDVPKEFRKGLITKNFDSPIQVASVEMIVLGQVYRGCELLPKWRPGVSTKPLCYSRDGVKSWGGTDPEPYDSCDTCGKNDISKWWKKHKEKPPCVHRNAVLAYDIGNDAVFSFYVKRKARDNFSALYSELMTKRAAEGVNPRHAWVVRWDIEEYGQGYLPVFTILKEASEEQQATAQGLYAQRYDDWARSLNEADTKKLMEEKNV
jgi:hypothetical protein